MELEIGLVRKISDQLAQRVTVEEIGVDHVAADANGGEHRSQDWAPARWEVSSETTVDAHRCSLQGR
jgi:hypothetical protein